MYELVSTSGETIDYSPATIYRVRVLKNIKGELVEDEPIKIHKSGAVVDGVLRIFEGDIILEEDNTYVLCAISSTHPDDGSSVLVVSIGSADLVAKGKTGAEAVDSSEITAKWVDACRDEIPYSRSQKWYQVWYQPSIYDKNYVKKPTENRQ
ncbi:MAG: hypothetical protein FWG10_01595 [Eubacteriaceae bacterium]|nr:hypothetical protein [Eubacteriaceae bacterium]